MRETKKRILEILQKERKPLIVSDIMEYYNSEHGKIGGGRDIGRSTLMYNLKNLHREGWITEYTYSIGTQDYKAFRAVIEL